MQNESQLPEEEPTPQDIIISERDIDSNYEPSIDEIRQYASYLGMNIEEDQEFFYIAEKGLKAPIPEPWRACQTKDKQIYYFNFQTGESQWEHPCDEVFRKEFREAKVRKVKEKNQTKQGIFNTQAKEAQTNHVNQLEISNISALLSNPSAIRNTESLEESGISGLNYSPQTQGLASIGSQRNLDKKTGQGQEENKFFHDISNEGGWILALDEPKKVEESSVSDKKRKEMMKIEQEFENKLKAVEQELAIKYEQTVDEYKQILQGRVEISIIEEKHSSSEIHIVIDHEEEIKGDLKAEEEKEVIQLQKAFRNSQKELQEQSDILLRPQLERLQKDFSLVIQAEKDKINQQFLRVEMERIGNQEKKNLINGGSAYEERKTKLLSEHNKSLAQIEADKMAELENEVKELKMKLRSDFELKRGQVQYKNFKTWNTKQALEMERMFEEILRREKERIYDKVQHIISLEEEKMVQVIRNLELDNKWKRELDNKLLSLEEERGQYLKKLQNSFNTHHSEMQRKYEICKLTFENQSMESVKGLKRDLTSCGRQLKTKENLIANLNRLEEESKLAEREIKDKEKQIYRLRTEIDELEMSLKGYKTQREHSKAKLENLQQSAMNRNSLLEKINQAYARLASMEKKVKELENERNTQKTSQMNRGGIKNHSLERIFREVEQLKSTVSKKTRRRSTPLNKNRKENLTEYSYFRDSPVERSSTTKYTELLFEGDEVNRQSNEKALAEAKWGTGTINEICKSSDISFMERGNRWKNFGKTESTPCRLGHGWSAVTTANTTEVSIDATKSKFYSNPIIEQEEEKLMDKEKSITWKIINERTNELNKGTNRYGEYNKRYRSLDKNPEEEKRLSISLTKDIEFENVNEQSMIENPQSLKGQYQSEKSWIGPKNAALGVRDTNINIKQYASCKTEGKSSNLYGRTSLQNTSTITSKYSSKILYPTYNKPLRLSFERKSIEREVPGRFLNLKVKLRNDKLFQPYDNLIRKYGS